MPFRNQTRSLYEGTLVSYTYSSPVCRDGLPNATIGSLLEQHRKIYLAAKYSTLLRESNVACRAASASQHRSIAMKRYLPTYPLPTYPLTHLPTHPPTYLPTYLHLSLLEGAVPHIPRKYIHTYPLSAGKHE